MMDFGKQVVASTGDALNIAGVDAKAAVQDQVQTVKSWDDYFATEDEKITRRQYTLWEPVLMRQLRFMLYYDFQQMLLRPPGRKGYITQRVEEKDQVWMFNLVREHTDEVTSMWLSVAPKIEINLMDDDFENEQARLDVFKALTDYFNRKHLTPIYVTELAKHAVAFGSYISECWFDKDSRKGLCMAPVVNQVGMDGYGMTMCNICDWMGEGSHQSCGSCGTPLVQQLSVPPVNGQNQSEPVKQKTGEIEDVLRLPCQVRYSMTTGFHNSSYLYIEDEMLREQAEYKFGREATRNASSKYFEGGDFIYPVRMLRLAERAEYTGLVQRDDDDETFLSQRIFRKPELLHWIQLAEPYDAPGFGQVPANVRLSEVFPEGMSIERLKGSKRCVNVEASNFRKRFTMGQFSSTPGRKDPQGLKELPEMNKVGNLMKSGMLVHILKYLNPSVAVADEVFGDKALFNRKDPVVRVSAAKAAAFQTGLAGSYLPLSPPPMNPAILPAIQLLDAAAQAAGKTHTADSADPTISADTATAWRIGEGRFTRNSGLYMAPYGDFLVNSTENKLDCARNNYEDIRCIDHTDENENRRALLIKKDDLMAEVAISVVAESLEPNIKLEEQEAAGKAIAAVTAYISAGGQVTPAVERTFNKAFGTDIKFNDQAERIEECEDQLDAAKALLQQRQKQYQEISDSASMLNTQVPPMNPDEVAMDIYMAAPVDQNRLDHDEKEFWWRKWKSSEQGRKADIVLQKVADFYIAAYAAAQVNEAQFMQMRAMLGQGLIQNPLMPQQIGPGGPPQGEGPIGGGGQPRTGHAAPPPHQLPPAGAQPNAPQPAQGGPANSIVPTPAMQPLIPQPLQ